MRRLRLRESVEHGAEHAQDGRVAVSCRVDERRVVERELGTARVPLFPVGGRIDVAKLLAVSQHSCHLCHELEAAAVPEYEPSVWQELGRVLAECRQHRGELGALGHCPKIAARTSACCCSPIRAVLATD
eukprot:scaffold87717_cov64-Phaeocystis_antarctica.AAC.14